MSSPIICNFAATAGLGACVMYGGLFPSTASQMCLDQIGPYGHSSYVGPSSDISRLIIPTLRNFPVIHFEMPPIAVSKSHLISTPLVDEMTEIEKELQQLVFNKDGTVSIPDSLKLREKGHPRAAEFTQKDGVIDVQSVLGCLIVVYNSAVRIPGGCPDLWSQGRSGEYDPNERICYIDLRDSWSYLNSKYEPELLNWPLAHELRHALVHHMDQRTAALPGEVMVERYWEDPASAELAYLDEMHSLFFDAAIFGDHNEVFRNFEQKLSTTVKTGSHKEMLDENPSLLEDGMKLFYCLQLLISLCEYSRKAMNPQLTELAGDIAARCGAILGLSRDVKQARIHIESECRRLFGNLNATS